MLNGETSLGLRIENEVANFLNLCGDWNFSLNENCRNRQANFRFDTFCLFRVPCRADCGRPGRFSSPRGCRSWWSEDFDGPATTLMIFQSKRAVLQELSLITLLQSIFCKHLISLIYARTNRCFLSFLLILSG